LSIGKNGKNKLKLKTMDDFETWLEELPTQTLTDELKDEIIERLEVEREKSYNQGYDDVKEEILRVIKNKI
jgi:hypothetical protein